MSGLNFTSIIDGSSGTAQGRVGTTIKTLVISIASGFILFAVQFIAFLCIRIHPWSKRIYQPRTYLVPLKNRVKLPPDNPFKWLSNVFSIPGPVLLEKSGMDAYFFMRYLSMCLKIFFPLAVLILPILIPLNVAKGKGTNTIAATRYNVTGLDKLAWSNVSPRHTDRYWAHLILGLIVIGWVCYLFHYELVHFVKKRQAYLSHAAHRLKASATSVLITDIPSALCTVEQLTEHYDDFPGGLRRIWINRDYRPLTSLCDQRQRIENQLENAETDLIRRCIKSSKTLRRRNEDTDAVEMQNHADNKNQDPNSSEDRMTEGSMVELCNNDLEYDKHTGALWTRYVSPSKRSTTLISKPNRTGLFKIPLVGRIFANKVDTIYFCRRELAKLNVQIEKEMEISETYPHIHSAFLQFNTQKAAHLACQSLSHPLPKAMTRRELEISPGDVNWPNLGLSWWQRYLRIAGFLLLFILLLFVFGVISFFTGILSQISTLGSSASWLNWVDDLPPWLLSFIQGTLPPVILIIVLSGPLPIFLRMFTNDIRGATSGTQGERMLQLWYFIFLLFELFIVPTISSGLTAVVKELIQDPTSVPNILATNLPTASNYYFSFLIVNGLSLSASSILQTIRLFNIYVIGSTNTPDSVFNSITFTNRTRIGSNVPWYTTFAVIGITYAVIAPLILVFILITFILFWFVIKNNLLYVVRTGNVDGGGLFFPEAINQTFTGLYFMQVCLIGLFFLVRDTNGNVACEAQGIIMAIALICTLIYQRWLYITFSPLYDYLPVTMEREAQQRDKEYALERLMASSKEEEAIDTRQKDARASDSTEATHAANEESEKRIRRTTMSSVGRSSSTDFAARACDIQIQQQRDGQSAKRILNRLSRPLDDGRLQELEHNLAHVNRAWPQRLMPRYAEVEQQVMNDPISKIIMQHNDELEDLNDEDRDLLISVAFNHPVLQLPRPSVWIPQDNIGVSDDEVRRTRNLSKALFIENRGAYFNSKLKVLVDKPPPDMSEFALLRGEL